MPDLYARIDIDQAKSKVSLILAITSSNELSIELAIETI
jgi:hypothetical protein